MATTVDARREKPRSSIATKSTDPRFMVLMIARLNSSTVSGKVAYAVVSFGT